MIVFVKMMQETISNEVKNLHSLEPIFSFVLHVIKNENSLTNVIPFSPMSLNSKVCMLGKDTGFKCSTIKYL